MGLEPIIKIKDLSVTYFPGKPNEKQALKDINLEIYPGEFVIFFGPSGCGKSTLLYTIFGLETNIKGEIWVDGKEISRMKPKETERLHQKKFGMIFQAYYLINSLSVIKNVILPQMSGSSSEKERKEKALGLLRKFGVEKEAYKLPNELSGGQQQRVAISRSLINDPDILLADEPVGNLDSKASSDVIGLLKELNESQRKTIILVTHDPSHLNIPHRVFYIKDGELVKIRENRKLESKGKKLSSGPDLPASKELALLEESYSDMASDAAGALLEPFKARELVLEVLSGLSSAELKQLEEYAARRLAGDKEAAKELLRYLDDNPEDGGLGLDSRRAKEIAEQLEAAISQAESLSLAGPTRLERIGNYLITELGLKIKGPAAETRFLELIAKRLSQKFSQNDLRQALDKPLKDGGLGLDSRLARKAARRLELIILSQYKGNF